MRVIIGLFATIILWIGLTRQPLSADPANLQYAPPEVISAVDAVYPVNSIAFGTVVLQVRLSASGEIEEVKVIRDIPSLTVEAKRAVMLWKFKPAALDGTPVESTIPVAFIFVHPAVSPRFGGQLPR